MVAFPEMSMVFKIKKNFRAEIIIFLRKIRILILLSKEGPLRKDVADQSLARRTYAILILPGVYLSCDCEVLFSIAVSLSFIIIIFTATFKSLVN